MKKLFIAVLSMLLLLSFTGTALADNDENDFVSQFDENGVRYTYIITVSANLDISGAGLASMEAHMTCQPSVDSCRISAYLQRYDGGWNTLQHWAQNYGTYYGYWNSAYYVTSGYNYRLLVYFYAYDGDARDSTYLTSTEYY